VVAFNLACTERGQRDAEEPNAFCDRKQRLEECAAELFEFASCPDPHLTGVASCDLPEVSKLNLESDGTSTSPGALAVLPNLVNDL